MIHAQIRKLTSADVELDVPDFVPDDVGQIIDSDEELAPGQSASPHTEYVRSEVAIEDLNSGSIIDGFGSGA